MHDTPIHTFFQVLGGHFQAHASIMQVFPDHIAVVQPLVLLLETALAISLMLGIAVGLAGIVGVLFILNPLAKRLIPGLPYDGTVARAIAVATA